MNKLSELNSYSNQGVLYSDPRSFEIVFSDETPDNTTDVCDEGDTPAVVIQTQITELYSSFNSNTFSVDVSACAGATVTWADSTGMNITSDSGVFTIDNIYSVARWQQARAATINLPRDYQGTFTYTATITYYDTISTTQSLSWSVVLTVNDLAEMYYPGNHTYDEDVAAVITNAPYILDLENDGSGPYIVTVVPDTLAAVTTLSSAGTGGSSVFDNETKTLTITGNRTQVNSHLASITLNPGADYDDNFDMIYTQVNPVSDLVTIANQLMLIGITNEELINMELTRFYHVNAADLIFTTQLPTIIESGTFTIRFILNTTGGFISHSSDASGWTAGTLTYEFTGTQAQCNEKFTQLRFWPDEDIDTNYTVTYRQIENGIEQAVNTFSLNHLTAYDQFTGGLTQTVLEDQQNAVLDLTDISPYWNSTVSMQVSLRVTATGAVASTSTVGTISGAGWTQNSPNILTKSLTVVDSSNFDYWDDLELDLITDWDDDIFVRQAITIDSVLVATRDLAITITPKTDSIGTFDINQTQYVADDFSSYSNAIAAGYSNLQPVNLGKSLVVVGNTVVAGDAPSFIVPTSQSYVGTPEPGKGIWINGIPGIQAGNSWGQTQVREGSVHDLAYHNAYYLAAGVGLRKSTTIGRRQLMGSSDGNVWTEINLPDVYTPSDSEQEGPGMHAIGAIFYVDQQGSQQGTAETYVGGLHGYVARSPGFGPTFIWNVVNHPLGAYTKLLENTSASQQPHITGLVGYRHNNTTYAVAVANQYAYIQNPSNPLSFPYVHIASYVCRLQTAANGAYKFVPIITYSNALSTGLDFQRLRLALPDTGYTSGIFMAVVRKTVYSSTWYELGPIPVSITWEIRRSTNNGATWSVAYTSNNSIRDIVWNGNCWTILKSNGIAMSRDPIGASWSESNSFAAAGGTTVTTNWLNDGLDDVILMNGTEFSANTRISNDTDYTWTVPAYGAYPEKNISISVPFSSNATSAIASITSDLSAENDQAWTITSNTSSHIVSLDMNNNTHTVYTQSLANAGNSVNANVGVVHTFTNSTTPH